MVDIPRRMIERSGPSMPSHIIPHIYKDPPKAAFTRKKERVSEADTTWMIRPDGPSSDPTRINEAINYYAKSVNPSVEIEYQNRGGRGNRTSAIKVAQAGSTYKLEVVRPPLFPVETTLPLSRPRTHQNKSVESNPGLSEGYSSSTLAYDLDQTSVLNAIQEDKLQLPISVQATSTYKVEQPVEMSANWALNENSAQAYDVMTNPGRPIDTGSLVCREESSYGTIIRPKYSGRTNVKLQGYEQRNDDASKKVREAVLLQNIRPNFQIVVYDPNNHNATEVTANIKEKNNIAIRASLGLPISLDRPDGMKVKLKDYTWTAVQTNVGLDQVILTLEDPEIQLERNVPLYAAETVAVAPMDTIERVNQEYQLNGKISAHADTNFNLTAGYDQAELRRLQGMTKLAERLPFSSFENPPNSIPTFSANQMPGQIRTKDTSRWQVATNESFSRIFG